MANNRVPFRPVRGTEAKILSTVPEEGRLYFATDTGRMYLGQNNTFLAMGGSGVTWYYAEQTTVDQDVNQYYIINPEAVESNSPLKVNDLIINTDGVFYKVLDYDFEGNYMCSAIAVSGGSSGGGGGSGPLKPDLSLKWKNIDRLGSTYVYGQDTDITFTPHSDTDDIVSLVVTAVDNTGVFPTVTRQERVRNDKAYKFNVNLLPASDDITLTVKIAADGSIYNGGKGLTITFPIHVLKMYLTKPSDLMIGIQQTNASLQYIPFFAGLSTDSHPVYVKYAIDGGVSTTVSTPLKSGNNEHRQYVDIPQQEHGMHIVELWLSITLDGKEYESDKISFEVPWVDTDDDTPIIWTRGNLDTVVNYEPAVIEYMVYSSVAEREGSTTEISLYHGNDLLNTEAVQYNSNTWFSMDVTPYYEVGNNVFTLKTGATTNDVAFYVTNQGARDLALRHESQLEVNFDALGRSSQEIKATRNTWISKCTPRFTNTSNPYEAILQNFNWYSNGWKNDNDGMGSYLSVTNGASVRIPMSNISINTNNQPWSFEIRFRIRNAKKFATLVTEIPKYRYYDQNGEPNELGQEKTLEEIQSNGYTVMRDSDGNMEMNEANTTKKIVETNKYIALKYLNDNNLGFAIGTQEAYFQTAGQVVNVKYKENEIINITFVIDKRADALSIYLNGILAGVANLSAVSSFAMGQAAFEISSEYCDFDLYKLRAYPLALSLPDVIHNYIADIKDISLYDENQLTDINDDTVLSYKELIQYNQTHPDNPTMPFCVIDMSANDNSDLPCYKGDKKKVHIEFTNPVADYLVTLPTNGIDALTYYTHCPSFTADDVEIDVQGTSSQKYPRRNFKAKFKKAKNWNYTQGELAGQPVNNSYTLSDNRKLSANWHEDHETIGSKSFTWKIDYMESSGSYNTGFANLLGSGIYNKHPLKDLGLADTEGDEFRTTVYGFPCLMFHKTGEDEYTYIGRYNFNLDKGSNERYGFELKTAHPYVTWQKEQQVMDGDTPVVDQETGEPLTETINYHPSIKEVAECWELRDNQGTWCSFRFPSAEMRNAGFKALMANSTETDTRYEVAQHFEARYHVDADPFEFAQNIVLGKQADDPDGSLAAAVGGDSPSIASNYVYQKMQNLEKLFKWLDSTDTTTATNTIFSEAISLPVSAKLTKKIANENYDYDKAIDKTNYPDYAEPEFIYVEDEQAMTQNGISEYIVENDRTYGIFTKDSVEYRRQKFYNEFNQHLDLHYCCIYFVMTELMMCYDSRGKNMMLASWGPRENGGEYIWYPIFYDIDTQLGLNNVGAKLWDYDEDSSENGTFSTKDSVLWTNLYDLFKNNIMSTYRDLRNGKLDELIIENAYMCRAGSTFNSYAMQGKRPIIALGLDAYYKYVMPVTVPWKDQTGHMTTANYLYACQGDRILSRELFIENRLLYMDSKWLGGTFTISSGGMAGISFRSTGNKPLTSSDIYLQGKKYNRTLRQWENDSSVVYPVPYYDATAEYYVTPYLNFYITTFVDENTFQTPEAYDEGKYPNGIPTVPSPSVVEGYRSGNVDQQLNYFAGSSYISSLGDLSLKYLNEIHFPNTPRLLDISIGSDVPGYFNAEVPSPIDLCTEINTDGTVKAGHEKPLLQKIILTNLTNLSTYLDVRSPDKLQEFRALGTKLTYALFAEGAPLTTVHLPETVTQLIFTENKNLTRILTTEPKVAAFQTDDNGDLVLDDTNNPILIYYPHETYEGLYVKNVTDYDPAMNGQGSPIKELSFDGDALGYGSYTILKNVVNAKNGNADAKLRIRMADISWTPYEKVEYGEAKQANGTYYYLTDHSTYESYDGHPDSDWDIDTLNGKVYTYNDTKDETTITSLELLDLFYQDYQSAVDTHNTNNFTNNIESMLNKPTYPTISGEMYVANAGGKAIDEFALTNKYAACWPNLHITAAKVKTANIVQFIQRVNNQDTLIAIDRYAKEGENAGYYPLVTNKVPTLLNYDFVGWTEDASKTILSRDAVAAEIEAGNVYSEKTLTAGQPFTDKEGNNLEFSNEKDVYTFYAVFTITLYTNTFKVGNKTVLTVDTPANSIMHTPTYIPAGPEDANLGLTETYKFLGWTTSNDYLNTDEDTFEEHAAKIDGARQKQNNTYYASFKKTSVYDNVLPTDYFTFTATTYTGINEPESVYHISEGWIIEPNHTVTLNGKITLPTTYEDKPVIAIGSGFNQYNITHVFWDGGNNLSFRVIQSEAFHATGNTDFCGLQYFEFPTNLRVLGARSFQIDNVLLNNGRANFLSQKAIDRLGLTSLLYINGSALQNCLNPTILDELIIPSTVRSISEYGMLFYIDFTTLTRQSNGQCPMTTIQIGNSKTEPSQLAVIGNGTYPGILASTTTTISGTNEICGLSENLVIYSGSNTNVEALTEISFKNITAYSPHKSVD